MDKLIAKKIASENLKRFRLLLGWKQQQVADAVGISRVAYRKIEAGESEPRTENLERLLEILHMSPFQLYRETLRPKSICLFRSKKVNTQHDQVARDFAVESALNKLRDYCDLESYLSMESVSGKTEFPLRASGESVSAYAARIRVFLLGSEPFSPTALIPLLEDRGIKILFFAFPEDLACGFSLGVADGGPAIVVNDSSDITAERKLFTLIHELGHLLMHHAVYGASYGGEEDVAREQEANNFASELLMPDAQFRRLWMDSDGLGWFRRILQMKGFFHVSYLTVLRRLTDDGFEKDYHQSIFRFRASYKLRFGDDLGRRSEPCGMRFVYEPIRFRKLARKAFEAGEITQSRLGELLGKDLFATRELVNEWSCEA